MKRIKLPPKPILVCIILLIPLYRMVLKTDSELWLKIVLPPFGLFCTIFGSGLGAFIGSIVMHFTARLVLWIFDEYPSMAIKMPEDYDDLEIFAYALWPILFAAFYYYVLTGKTLF